MTDHAVKDAIFSRPDVCDVFIKVGGSILDNITDTTNLIPCLVDLSKKYRIVAMTGGGRVAKRIVANQRKHGSDFMRSWKSGITSLDVHAGLLGSHSPQFSVGTYVSAIREILAQGKMAILAPAAKIVSDFVLVPDFEVTTDSMGLYFAALFGAARYVIVSDVDGIYERAPISETIGDPMPFLRLDDMGRLSSSKLDPAFPVYFRRFPMPAIVVNGKHPDRVGNAICGKPTIGTQIVLHHSTNQILLHA
jgi:5-(aminomethyl)-3-furanmethanol phosphate kinase